MDALRIADGDRREYSTADLAAGVLDVGQVVSAGAALVWLWLFQAAGFRQCLVQLTLQHAAAVTGKTRVQASRHLAELETAGLVAILTRQRGRRGGIELRVSDPRHVLAPGLAAIRGDPQRPLPGLVDEAEGDDQVHPSAKVTPEAKLPLQISPPIMNQAARASNRHGHGHDQERTREHDLEHDHDGGEGYKSKSHGDDSAGLAAAVARRRRQGAARGVSREISAEVTSDAARQHAARHSLVCETIVAGVADRELPIGLVHDVADLVVAGELGDRVLARILSQLSRRRASIDSPGAYFRACINAECDKRGVARPTKELHE